MTDTHHTEKATFAAGCFWGVEAEFRQIPGVIATIVEYDPAQVTYDQLLDAFWQLHDPTQLNRQGPDVGDQYRSAIFFHSPEQEIAAKASKEAAQARFKRPIVTEIIAAPEFWSAEDYHQRYLEKRGMASCAITVSN
jgi:peptide-methionine (S)-S-oxide reductase